MRPTPKYIAEAGIATKVARYPWDEWRCKDYYRFTDEGMFERLDLLTNKANTSLCIAIGEWVRERFSLLDPDPTLGEYLEAAWAGAIRPEYCIYVETDDDAWRGPIRGPMALTLTVVNDVLFTLLSNPHAAERVCWLYNLASHVLPNTEAFEHWFEACVLRLERYYSQAVDTSEEEDLFADLPWQGSPVPREAFEPAFDYSPAAAPSLLDAFLRGLKPESNPFLRAPDELSGIEEIPMPYQYSQREASSPSQPPVPR